MNAAFANLLAATPAFVVLHFAMSGALRRPLIRALGRSMFMLTYSMVSIGTFAWAIVAFDRMPSAPLLWDGMHPLAWLTGSVLTVAALAMLLPSFARNPALPGAKAAGLGTVIPNGVFTITRHPMMWGITLWALAHVIVAPSARVIVLMTGMIVLALAGSHLQDKRKLAGNAREFAPWQRRTSFWPQIRNLGAIKLVWLASLILWTLLTWVHWHFFGIPAGLWMWIG